MKEITTAFIHDCLKAADNGQSKVGERELEIHSTSSRRLKSLVNNICSKPNTRYLEIGVYKGGSFISAAIDNKGFEGVGVDNFRYDDREPKKWAPVGRFWDNMKSHLEANMLRYSGRDTKVDTKKLKIIEKDWKDVNWNAEKRFDVCFFDLNPVTAEDYELFFTTVYLALADDATIIFSNYSNERHANALDNAIANVDTFTILGKEHRISGGLSDDTHYGSGVLVLTIQKNKTKGK